MCNAVEKQESSQKICMEFGTMETLSQNDFFTLNRVIGEIHSICNTEGFHRNIFTILKQVISFDRASYNNVDSDYIAIASSHDSDESEAFIAPYQDIFRTHYFEEHPWLQYKSGVRTVSEMKGYDQFRKKTLYNDYYKKLGNESQMICTLAPVRHSLEAYNFLRGPRDFSERDKLIFNLLRPHIVDAYRNAAERGRFVEENTMLRIAAETEEHGTILLTEEGKMKWTSRRAREWLAEYLGLPLKEMNRLPHPLSQWVRREICSPETVTEREALIIEHPTPFGYRGKSRLIIRIVYNAHTSATLEKPNEDNRGFMLLIYEEDTSVPETFALTPRETEVLKWVAEGKTNGTIAIILEINVRTVEKHLEHIFKKLDVETRSAAAVLAKKRP